MSDFFADLLRIGKTIVEASEKIQAEIDRHEPLPRPTSESVTASSSAEAANLTGDPHYSQQYLKHLLNGCPDPLELLTAQDAAQLMGCAMAEPSTTGEEEYISVHYGCADDRSMYVSLSVSALMPWDFVQTEVSTSPAPQPVGDESLVADDMLYVRQGERFFWIYGRGITDATLYRIAKHVAERMAE